MSSARTRAALAAVVLLFLPFSSVAQPAPRLSSDEMKEWLTYLSSDELQGRQVFTEGLGLAASYIADHLKAWGVTPAGDDGTYFQTVKVLGMRTRSRSSVTVTVNGRSRTFADGDGVTFPRKQGSKQVVTGRVVFTGYGLAFAPLHADDYAGVDAGGKVVVYLGQGGAGFTTAQNRIVATRGRDAVDAHHAVAAIGPARESTQPAAGTANEARRVDFQTTQVVDAPEAPLLTASDEFFTFLFTGSGQSYDDIKARAARREPLPKVALDATVTVNIDADYELVQTRLTRNIVGIVEGTDPALKDSYVLFGAHYDHVGYQQFTGTDAAGVGAIASCAGQTRPTPRPGDIINNGADDDGSGTVSLMALAKAFATGEKPKRSVLLLWHTGEEAGLYGSRYMADHPVVPIDHMAAELNIDMVGRNRCDNPADANTVYLVGSDRISTELHNINEDANAALATPLTLDYELNDVADLESLYTRSDHYSYASKGVPIIFFTTGLHRDYHYVTDEVDKILFPKMVRIAELVYATGWRVANLDHLPVRDNRGPRIGVGKTGRIGR